MDLVRQRFHPGRVILIGMAAAVSISLVGAEPADPKASPGQAALEEILRSAKGTRVAAPPAGKCDTMEAVVKALANHREIAAIPPGGWLVGRDVDPAVLGGDPVGPAAMLDQKFPGYKVVLVPVGGLQPVLSSPAREWVKTAPQKSASGAGDRPATPAAAGSWDRNDPTMQHAHLVGANCPCGRGIFSRGTSALMERARLRGAVGSQ